MRLPVRSKLVLSLSALIAFGLVVIGLSFHALTAVRGEVDNLAKHRQPLVVATHGLEMNVNVIGMAVLAYLESARPTYLESIQKERLEIERHAQRYAGLANSSRESRLAAVFRSSLDELLADAQTLLKKRDAMTATLVELAECADEIDVTVHSWVRRADALPAASRGRAGASARAALAVEAEMAEVGAALMWRHSTTMPSRHKRYLVKLGELESAVSRLAKLPLDPIERGAAEFIVAEERQIAGLIRKLIALEDEVERTRERFIAQIGAIDRLLDEEIRILAHESIEVSLLAVDRVTQAAVAQIGFILLPMFVISALVLGLFLYRSVTRPLLALAKGMRAVGQGDLAKPIVGLQNDEFGDLADEFNRMTQQLRDRVAELLGKDAELQRRETLASMGSLVSGVAHEVRNPLFGITSTVDALQARLHNLPEQSRHIEVLRGETSRLQKLMQDLLDYGKPAPHVRETTDLFALIENAIAECLTLARERHVHVSCDLRGPPPILRLDPRRMEQVFVNLVENALQHSPARTSVSVTARWDDGPGAAAVVCTVSDQGCGFRTEDLHRVFEPFFTRRQGGTGLGLSIVQRIVEEHGGTIAASNGAEGGAVMTLRLPAPARHIAPARVAPVWQQEQAETTEAAA
jgi:signal transduction histidine kinase